MDLFIRTYRGDAAWLSYLLRSIKKFCSGYHEILVAYPRSDAAILEPLIDSRNVTGLRKVVVDDDAGTGYMAQQYTKMTADIHSTADYIAFLDSDCLCTVPNNPQTWMEGDKIRYLITPYEILGITVPWKPITEKALKFECKFETMRRHPCVFPREVITHCREYMEQIHGKPLRDYISEQPHGSFSEFNVMGSYALQKESEKFMFLDTTKNPLPPEVIKQRWSYGGLTPLIFEENERILA